MRIMARIAVGGGGLVLVVVAFMAYGTLRHRIVWFAASRGASVLVNGTPTRGSVVTGGEWIIITRSDGQPKSYVVVLSGSGGGHRAECGTWIAPQWPLFPLPADPPPCWGISALAKEPAHRVKADAHGFSFTADDGATVEVRW